MTGIVSAIAVSAAICASCGVATAQMPSSPIAPPSAQIVAQWALRGVVVSTTGRSSAILEYLPSGRQELVGTGVALTPTLSVSEVDPDRVVLVTEGGGTTVLRLTCGGPSQVARPTIPQRRARWQR